MRTRTALAAVTLVAVGAMLGWLAGSGRFCLEAPAGPSAVAGQIQRTTIGEGMDVGMDVGSAVDFTYNLPFTFTGKIEKVVYELK